MEQAYLGGSVCRATCILVAQLVVAELVEGATLVTQLVEGATLVAQLVEQGYFGGSVGRTELLVGGSVGRAGLT